MSAYYEFCILLYKVLWIAGPPIIIALCINEIREGKKKGYY